MRRPVPDSIVPETNLDCFGPGRRRHSAQQLHDPAFPSSMKHAAAPNEGPHIANLEWRTASSFTSNKCL